MELLNILDKSGNVIGSKDIKEIYKDGDIHGTVHIWILNSKNELLLQKRNPKKETFPNLWALSTAGHVRAGETYEQTALRELKEELNLDIKPYQLEYLFKLDRNQVLDKHKINTIDRIYLLRMEIDTEHTKLQKSELTDIKFVNYKELKKIYKNEDKDYVPKTEEHDLLFNYIESNLNAKYKTTTEYTYEEYTKLSLFNTKYDLSNITIMMIFIILFVVGIVNQNWLFYFAIFSFIMFVFSIEPRAKKKANRVYEILGYDTKHEESYEFYNDFFKTNDFLIKYNQLLKVCEFRENIYLYINPKQAFIIKNEEDIAYFLKEKTNYKRYSK